MILDKENMFSEAQALTSDADSTNIIDLGVEGYGKGQAIPIFIQVQEAFDNLTNIKFTLQSAVNAAFTTTVSHQSVTVLLASLDAVGDRVNLGYLPEDVHRYVKIDYDLTGSTPTAGKVDAGLVLDKQTNEL